MWVVPSACSGVLEGTAGVLLECTGVLLVFVVFPTTSVSVPVVFLWVASASVVATDGFTVSVALCIGAPVEMAGVPSV